MNSRRLRQTLPTLYTLAVGVLACGCQNAPPEPAAPLTFVALSAGAVHTCGIQALGTVYCWGRNLEGQLGDGTTTDRLTPVLASGAMFFNAVSAGAGHTCGVTVAGAAYCWGDDASGQLGDGTKTSWLTPVRVAGGVSFAAVSAGDVHTCGVTAARAAYCWGDNSSGQLGDGTTTSRLTPVSVAGGVSFIAVSAGHSHTCGVTATGAGYCWGHNFSGQLGDGTSINRLTPVLVAGGVDFTAVSVGGGGPFGYFGHSCGVTAAGAVYCWGDNGAGQLGDETTTNRLTPVRVAGGLNFAGVSAGGTYYTCAVTAAGAVYCWGDNRSGNLGDRTTTSRSNPAVVAGGVSFAAVSAGRFGHTCGVTAAGAAYCWGDNGSGQLGDGTTTSRLSPVRVE